MSASQKVGSRDVHSDGLPADQSVALKAGDLVASSVDEKVYYLDYLLDVEMVNLLGAMLVDEKVVDWVEYSDKTAVVAKVVKLAGAKALSKDEILDILKVDSMGLLLGDSLENVAVTHLLR